MCDRSGQRPVISVQCRTSRTGGWYLITQSLLLALDQHDCFMPIPRPVPHFSVIHQQRCCTSEQMPPRLNKQSKQDGHSVALSQQPRTIMQQSASQLWYGWPVSTSELQCGQKRGLLVGGLADHYLADKALIASLRLVT